MIDRRIGIVAGIGLLIIFGAIYLGSALSFRSDCVTAEAGLKAQQDQVKNNYDNMWKRVREMAQVPAMYEGSLKRVFDSAMQGRW